MNQFRKGMLNSQFRCEICQITSMSHAEYALHEFTKKHCDNLIRVSKNKPILKKQKTKDKIPEMKNETNKVNTATHSGSFSKYGYFIPGEVYTATKVSKEFNSDYDPYLQKFAESSYKEETKPLVKEESQQPYSKVITHFATATQRKKKKKSGVKMCHICNVELLTTHSYTVHMKSVEHILKLKVSGMGVSAHFVKSSSDLQTTKDNKDQKACQDLIAVNGMSNSSSGVSPSNCNNSELARKYHADESIRTDGKKKFSKKEKLFCYTCNIVLHTLSQYKEHKNGRKHRSKCRALIEKGMTIPPEERIPDFPVIETGPPIYPPKYELMIASRQKSACPVVQNEILSTKPSSILQPPAKPDLCAQDKVLIDFNKKSGESMTPSGTEDKIDCEMKVSKVSNNELVKKSNSNFHKIKFVAGSSEKPNSENSSIADKNFFTNKVAEDNCKKSLS